MRRNISTFFRYLLLRGHRLALHIFPFILHSRAFNKLFGKLERRIFLMKCAAYVVDIDKQLIHHALHFRGSVSERSKNSLLFEIERSLHAGFIQSQQRIRCDRKRLAEQA